jgi:hypothetical protein
MPDLTILWVAFIVFFVVGILNSFLKANWNRLYFTMGPPIYTCQVPMKSLSVNALDIDRMESEFPSSMLQNGLKFKQFDSNLYAFQGRSAGRNNNELMHGLIVFDQTQLQVIVKGYSDITNLVGLIFAMVVGFIFFHWWGVLFALVVLLPMGVMFFFQMKRYRKVAEKAAELAATPSQAL